MAAAGVSDSRITSILSATMKAAKFAVVEISNVVERPWDARAIGRTSEIPRRLVRTKRDKLPCVPSLDPPYVGVKNDCTERDSYYTGSAVIDDSLHEPTRNSARAAFGDARCRSR